jgi:hypothetical protein
VYYEQGAIKPAKGFLDWYISLTHAACCSAQLLVLARDSRMGRWIPTEAKDQLITLCKGNCQVPAEEGSWSEWREARKRDRFGFPAFSGKGEAANLMNMPFAMELKRVPSKNGLAYRAMDVEGLVHALSTGLQQCMVARQENLHFVSRRKRDREGAEDDAALSAGQQSP